MAQFGPDRVKTQNASRYNRYWLAQASQSCFADGCRHRFICISSDLI